MPPIVGWTPVLLRRQTRAAQDEYGNDEWVTVELQVDGCRVEPRTSTEVGGAQVITGAWLYAPTGTVIDADDEIEAGGVRYEVDGEPGVWRSGDGVHAFQQVALRRVTG